jgi:hypothetical protein
MEVDAFDGHVVYGRLRLGKTLKEVNRTVLSITRQAGSFDRSGYLFQAVVAHNPGLGARDSGLGGQDPGLGARGSGLGMMLIVVTSVIVFMIVVVMMMMSLTVPRVFVPPELGRRYSGAQHALGGDAADLQREAPQRQAELLERQADIEQRTKHHVPGRSGETIEVRGFRHVRGFPSREN